jgi:hypothetical protein
VDQRLLLSAVCRSWHAALREVSLWRELDFSLAGGVTRRVTRSMINAAVRYARGQLRLLDVRGAKKADVPFKAILDLARENADSLTTLRVVWSTDEPFNGDHLLKKITDVDALLAAAPRLTTIECEARCEQSRDNRDDAVDLQPLLEAAALHSSPFNIYSSLSGGTNMWNSLPDRLAVVDALTGHCSLTSFVLGANWLTHVPTASHLAVGEALGRLMAAESRLEHLDLSY